MTRELTRHSFRNALAILRSLDKQETPFPTLSAYQTFDADPYRGYLRSEDATQQALWEAIERRMGPDLSPLKPEPADVVLQRAKDALAIGERADRYEQALRRILQWSEAYSFNDAADIARSALDGS